MRGHGRGFGGALALAAAFGCAPAFALAGSGCGEGREIARSSPSGEAAASTPRTEVSALPASLSQPIAPTAPRVADPNPLALPPARVKLEPGRRVFACSPEMLTGARLGSTLVLYAATVVSLDGDDVVVEGRGGAPYKVHPGYVVAPDVTSVLRPRDAVLAEWAGVLKHAVVTKLAKGRVVVRFTDLEGKTGEAQLFTSRGLRIGRQQEGLRPGNYAMVRTETGFEHVLLVSQLAQTQPGKWLALGFAGAARLVPEADLVPIPTRGAFREGAEVLGEWLGKMRQGTVQSADDPGFFTVKFERAGRPAMLGWGRVAARPPVTTKKP